MGNGFKRTFAALAVSAGALGGCATTNGHPQDPFEGFNRAVFSFNETLDDVALKPVAQAYEAVVPMPARTGVSNAFYNLEEPWTALNNLIQGKPAEAASDVGRFLINATLGIFGLFDVASEIGMERHNEDFGQTLGRWGMGDGPYLVLPLIGPRTARDFLGFLGDLNRDRAWNIDHIRTRNSAVGLRLINDRANLLPAEGLLDEASLDKYAYTRSAYLQRRRSLIYDGNPPRERFDDSALELQPRAALDPVDASLGLLFVAHPAAAGESDAPSGGPAAASQSLNAGSVTLTKTSLAGRPEH